MTRDVTLLGYGVLAAATVAYHVAGLMTRRVPTAGQVVSLAVRSPIIRWTLLTGWLWLGWHLFVRASRG